MKQYHLNWEEFKKEGDGLSPHHFQQKYEEYVVHHGLEDSFVIWLKDGFYKLEMYHDHWSGTDVSLTSPQKVTDPDSLMEVIETYEEVIKKLKTIATELKKQE